MTNSIKNKDQYNDDKDYEPKFDNKFSLSSGSNRDILPVVTVALRGGKKNRSNVISGVTFLWDSVSIDIMINRIHTRPYEHIICSNKADYSNATDPYCSTQYSKVLFFIPEFSISKIILHHFHVANDEVELVTGYDMIIGR